VKNSPCDDLNRGKIAFAVRDALRETDPDVTDERVRAQVKQASLSPLSLRQRRGDAARDHCIPWARRKSRVGKRLTLVSEPDRAF
jgi:hypothetical protein